MSWKCVSDRSAKALNSLWTRHVRSSLLVPLRTYFRYWPFELGKTALWRHVANRSWSWENNIETTTVYGQRIYVNARDIVGRYIHYFGVWEPSISHWMSTRLHHGDVVVDVGANVGYYSLLSSLFVGATGRVVAVEPLPDLFSMLVHNIQINRAPNIRAVAAAAWGCEGDIAIFTRVDSPVGVTSVMPAWAKHWRLRRNGYVRARRLVDMLEPDEVRRARIIKIDVEGAEAQVIRGMEPMLSSCRKDLELVIEITPRILESQGLSLSGLFAFFEAQGFHPYQIENDYTAERYCRRKHVCAPERITNLPHQLFQIDVVFSHVDAKTL